MIVIRNIYKLTNAEKETAQLMCQGMNNKDIAQQLQISSNVLAQRLACIYAKLDVHNRAQAIAKLSVYQYTT